MSTEGSPVPAATVLKCSWADVRDPAPLLAALRQRQQLGPVWLVWDRLPETVEEENYIKLFEEFKPRLCQANDLTHPPSSEEGQEGYPHRRDHGSPEVLEAAERSPEPYDLTRLSVPVGPFFPPTGEYLQRLMDYTVLDELKRAEIEHTMGIPVPPSRRLYIENTWPAEIYETTRSLFVYPEKGVGEAVVAGTWPALRLLCFHNSDHTIRHALFEDFLARHPRVTIWMANTMGEPRAAVRTVPLFVQNAHWRGGSVDKDVPYEVCRSAERSVPLLFPYCSPTNAVRLEWFQSARGMRQERLDMEMVGKVDREEYDELLESAVAVVSPPGNGADTHRVWETLYKGGWPIVEENDHTRNLLADYPSLPLLPIKDGEGLLDLKIPAAPSPFHPLLLREFWVVHHRSLTLY